jgi:hypothetical protein
VWVRLPNEPQSGKNGIPTQERGNEGYSCVRSRYQSREVICGKFLLRSGSLRIGRPRRHRTIVDHEVVESELGF